MKTAEVLQAWSSIPKGRVTSLSIEITKECPLRCPGCHAFNAAHLDGDMQLRQLSPFKGDELVARVLFLASYRVGEIVANCGNLAAEAAAQRGFVAI